MSHTPDPRSGPTPSPGYGPGYPPPQAPKKKRRWPLIVALIVAAIVIIAVVSSRGSGNNNAAPTTGAPQSSSAPSSTSAAAPTTKDPFSDGGWKISDIQVQKSQFGTSVTGRVTNQTSNTQSGVFTLTVFSNGQRIGDFQGAANDVEAGTTSTVTFIGSTDQLPGDPATYTYEFQSEF